MVFKICLKRLRYSVYALFALTLCYRFAERWDSGALYSLFLFILLPLFVLALVWAVYTSIRDTARYKRSGVLPNDPPTSNPAAESAPHTVLYASSGKLLSVER